MDKVLVLGATGLVGRTCIEILQNYAVRVDAAASDRSENQVLIVNNQAFVVKGVSHLNYSDYDVVFLCVSASVAKSQYKRLISSDCLVIDNSSAFRMHGNIPLVVASLNLNQGVNKQWIASPNCVVTPLVMVLSVIQKVGSLSAVFVATYQSLSGAGQAALNSQGDYSNRVIPFIGDVDKDTNRCSEEVKIINEVKRLTQVSIEVMTVRVPVNYGHSMVLHAQLPDTINFEQLVELFKDCPYITLHTESAFDLSVVRKSMSVHIGRIVVNESNQCTIWFAADNLYLGAAGNMCDILKQLCEMKVEEK
ncbi:hypothetical protein MMH89_01215 [Candidatus Comchoanobacter bicostacola]|uniref:Semialdehyde dehydrogenase NAD-binding domain-containing protein n=1 Tax=Candidatus Comchoanobacter bicostacola TaxID=2919598 RepID=A0ABY5DLD7_9GAMM|nr:Asd/ArgC dimerization domain-containing protein [Candidatus Comchoanobacter bicostacola]UTC24773.1 hypothetical protein MMH89_01215 [Candidatus Comchoanobacter bicostacola]